MTAIAAEAWPSAELDGVRRLRVLAAALPGVQLEERALDHPFEAVWGVVNDIERNVYEIVKARFITRINSFSKSGQLDRQYGYVVPCGQVCDLLTW